MSGEPNPAALDCDSALRILWDYLDGQLTPERVDQVKAHLRQCAGCFRAFQIQEELLRRVGETTAPDDPALTELRAKVRDALRRSSRG